MEPANDLIAEFIAIKERYERLLDKYNAFVAQIIAVKESDVRLNGIDIISNDNSLTIKYLDRELIAKFSFSISTQGNRRGYIDCFKTLSNTEPDALNIHSFSFNAQGVTDIPSKDENDPYEIHDRSTAINILFHWIRLSFNEDS